jgi:hypothetical protein
MFSFNLNFGKHKVNKYIERIYIYIYTHTHTHCKWIVFQCENWKNMNEIYKTKKGIFMFFSKVYFGKMKR